MLNGFFQNLNKDKSLPFQLKVVYRIPSASTVPKKSTSRMKSSISIKPGKEYMYPEPGKLHQVDYRVFKFTIELGFEDRLAHGYAITDLINRVNE